MQHVHKNEKCIKVYLKCICNKVFYDINCLKSHQCSKGRNSSWYQKFLTKSTNTKFNSSEVTIQPVRKTSKIPLNASLHDFQQSLPIQDNLMIAKKNVHHTKFQSTLKF